MFKRRNIELSRLLFISIKYENTITGNGTINEHKDPNIIRNRRGTGRRSKENSDVYDNKSLEASLY